MVTLFRCLSFLRLQIYNFFLIQTLSEILFSFSFSATPERPQRPPSPISANAKGGQALCRCKKERGGSVAVPLVDICLGWKSYLTVTLRGVLSLMKIYIPGTSLPSSTKTLMPSSVKMSPSN